jgi:hypothetical protein
MAIRGDEHASAKAHRVEDRLVLGDQRVDKAAPRRELRAGDLQVALLLDADHVTPHLDGLGSTGLQIVQSSQVLEVDTVADADPGRHVVYRAKPGLESQIVPRPADLSAIISSGKWIEPYNRGAGSCIPTVPEALVAAAPCAASGIRILFGARQ